MRRHHELCCGMDSEDFETEDYQRVTELTAKLERYAKKLGFQTFSEADGLVDGPNGTYLE
jgi:hypothetical protein